jgi:hypothetical protein
VPGLADPLPLQERKIPDGFSERQRREFLEISNRAKVELSATFSLVAIGLQLYLETYKLAASAHASGT